VLDSQFGSQGQLGIGAHGIPDAFASLDVPEVVDAFWMMFRLAVHDGVKRLQLSIGRKDRVDIGSASVGKPHSDLQADGRYGILNSSRVNPRQERLVPIITLRLCSH
jgi:hypothetical protein